jgi:nitroreductase
MEDLVRAGMAAPSAVNMQPWRFMIVTKRELLDSLAERLPYAKMLSGAPAAISVCGDIRKTTGEKEREYWVQDCSAATENILLAAHGGGLGAVWTAVYPVDERIDIVQDLLDLPTYIVPLNVIALGYPSEKRTPKDKWDKEKIQWF